MDVERANHWIARGAQPTPAVQRLLKAAAAEAAVGTGTDEPAVVCNSGPVQGAATDSLNDTSEINGQDQAGEDSLNVTVQVPLSKRPEGREEDGSPPPGASGQDGTDMAGTGSNMAQPATAGPTPTGPRPDLRQAETKAPEQLPSNIVRGALPRKSSNSEIEFAQQFYDIQPTRPSPATEQHVSLPEGGPKTLQSARDDTARSSRVGRTEPRESKIVKVSVLGPKGQALENDFKNMVKEDYGSRCQICGSTFTTSSGKQQVNVVHVVLPGMDHRANHFGNLLGLCGWHFNLLRFGEKQFINLNTGRPFKDIDGTYGWEHLRTFISNRKPDIDDSGNEFFTLPIRFLNVYHDWKSESKPLNAKIRYSKPHWEYLCELLKA